MLETSKRIKLDQSFLETVIPNIDGKVRVLKGPRRGSLGILRQLDIEKFQAKIQVAVGDHKGEVLKLPYESFSKIYE
jgi:hypothetical protein